MILTQEFLDMFVDGEIFSDCYIIRILWIIGIR